MMNDSDIRAKLMKWPSLGGERVSARDGAIPYTILQAPLPDCVDRLRVKPESTRHLYEIHLPGGAVLSADEALHADDQQPPAEEDYGGGDIVSVECEPSTEDDQPLD
jgi:hypothetical protein